jgi:hypothetical protein
LSGIAGCSSRPVLPPAGQPAIDQSRIARRADIRSQPQPLHHAGPEPLDQRVGLRDQVERAGDPLGGLEIDRQRPASPAAQIEFARPRHTGPRGFEPLDRDHFGAEIGEQHRAHRRRADAGEFDNANAGERTASSYGPYHPR